MKKSVLGRAKCRCGYVFTKTPSIQSRKFESFAIVSDKDYLKFLRAEARVSSSDSESSKMRAIAQSSQYVGALMECPECSRLLLSRPNPSTPDAPLEFYTREQ